MAIARADRPAGEPLLALLALPGCTTVQHTLCAGDAESVARFLAPSCVSF